MDFVAWTQIAPKGRTIVLDIDSTLVPDGGSAVEARVVNAVVALKEHNQVYLFSNKGMLERDTRLSMLLGVPLIAPQSPVSDPQAPKTLPAGALVVGDRWLTDSLLAWRSGGEFVRVSRAPEVAPIEPKVEAEALVKSQVDGSRDVVGEVIAEATRLFWMLKPTQWLRNLLVFVPLFFARGFLDPHATAGAAAAFAALCLTSSAISLVRDFFAPEADLELPTGRSLSLATLPWSTAVLCLGLLVGSGLLLWVVAPAALPPLALYAVWAVAYHVLLRNIEIIELLVAMWLYYARVVVGGAAAGVPLPTWLSLCLIFLALVAVLGARSMQLRGGRTRSVLAAYPREFLAGMLFLSAGMAIVFYALFAVLSVRSLLMIYSILPLLAGIMRYLQLTLAPGTQVGQVLKDRGLLISAAVWLAMVVAIFYF